MLAGESNGVQKGISPQITLRVLNTPRRLPEATEHSVPTGTHPEPCEYCIKGKPQSSRKNGTAPVTDSPTREPDTDEEQEVDLGLGV